MDCRPPGCCVHGIFQARILEWAANSFSRGTSQPRDEEKVRQPTRLPRPWDSPGKNAGVGCHFLLQCVKVKVKSLSRVRLFATPWTAAYQATLSMGFSRQEYWSGVPLPSPKNMVGDSFPVQSLPPPPQDRSKSLGLVGRS